MEDINVYKSNSSEETQKIAFEFAETLESGDTVLLDGELGSGKTEFTKGICNYFEVEDLITSPTFTIINQYFPSVNNFNLSIYHIDLYRIKELKELNEIGLNEILNDINSIKIVEWCFKIPVNYPENSYLVRINFDKDNSQGRIIKISRFTNDKSS